MSSLADVIETADTGEIDEEPDGGTPEERATKTRRYIVQKQTGEDTWKVVNENVVAVKAEDAIKEVAMGNGRVDEGTYVAIPGRSFQTKTVSFAPQIS